MSNEVRMVDIKWLLDGLNLDEDEYVYAEDGYCNLRETIRVAGKKQGVQNITGMSIVVSTLIEEISAMRKRLDELENSVG